MPRILLLSTSATPMDKTSMEGMYRTTYFKVFPRTW